MYDDILKPIRKIGMIIHLDECLDLWSRICLSTESIIEYHKVSVTEGTSSAQKLSGRLL